MTPTFMNSSSPSPRSLHGTGSNENNDHHHFFGTANSSSSNYSCHFYFNSSPQHQSPGRYYNNQQLYQPQQIHQGDNYGGSYDELETKGKLEDQGDKNVEKWIPSKMKNSDQKGVEKTRNTTLMKREDQKRRSSLNYMETDNSSNSSSNNGHTLIRVCSDCNTSKTPLWRSGPKGPKSLCNACGIRQRKARRAMADAASAAAANGTTQLLPSETPTVKIKVHHKEKTKNNVVSTVPFKKRCKVIAGSSQEPNKKLGFEDYLINLSNNLALHHVFPQDEKEAAILLMALSCGLVHT